MAGVWLWSQADVDRALGMHGRMLGSRWASVVAATPLALELIGQGALLRAPSLAAANASRYAAATTEDAHYRGVLHLRNLPYS